MVATRESEMPMSDSIIHLVDVTKVYDIADQPMRAIDNVSLEIGRGEFISVMGPSCSGKTTLLNLISGLDDPSSGEVIIEGRTLATLPDRARASLRLKSLGFVFQNFNLIPSLTVHENVSWPLEFSGCKRSEVRDRTADALRRVGVLGREHRYPAELSGGEQQRVAIARAIATQPSILLADEPTGNLDSLTGRSILDLVRELNQANRVTVVMVTHNIWAATYGDRTIELRDGKVVRDVRSPPTGRSIAAAAPDK